VGKEFGEVPQDNHQKERRTKEPSGDDQCEILVPTNATRDSVAAEQRNATQRNAAPLYPFGAAAAAATTNNSKSGGDDTSNDS